MGLRLEIISQQRQSLGEIGTKEFGHNGGTIGRSLSNDWALPDRNRFLSAKHAAIDYRSGSYYIIDTSTNGVFVNESDYPVGRGNPQRLFDGDRIRIGEYLILSKIEVEDNSSSDSFSFDNHHVDPVDAAQRVEAPEETSYDLLDEQVMTGVGLEIDIDETEKSAKLDRATSMSTQLRGLARAAEETTANTRSLLIENSPSAKRSPQAAPTSRTATTTRSNTQPLQNRGATLQPRRARPPARPQRPTTHTQPARPHPPAPQPPRPTPAAARSVEDSGAEKPLSAFFRGAGLKDRELNEQEFNAMLFLLGQLVRELMDGVTTCLHQRAQQKSQLKLANTTIQKRDNNPLKFSAGTTEALTNLLFRTSREYLGPTEAVRGAFADINAHQQGLLNALNAAVPEYVSRLDPVVLEDKFARAGGGSLIGGTSRLKHWELYKDLFQVVAHYNPGQLPAQFLEELSKAYEAECEREAATRGQTDPSPEQS